MDKNMKIRYFVYGIGITAIFTQLLRFSIFVLTNSDPLEYIFLLLSISISGAALVIRYWVIDFEKVSTALESTKRDYKRFLNFMPIAMLICTLADFAIKVDFIAGMLLFLVAQITYVSAYTGIISLNPKSLFQKDTRNWNLLVTVIWVIVPSITYFFLIFNPEDFVTLAVIPYVLVLSLMGLTTFFILNLQEITARFRFLLAGGGMMFFISDAILAINKFNTNIDPTGQWIGLTYLMALILLQYAVLFLRTPDNVPVFK